MLWNSILLALREIRRNMMRSFLTILGVMIGVAAVILMVTIGAGATIKIQEQIASMGDNLLMITPGKRLGPGQSNESVPFKESDAKAIAREIRSVSAAVPVSSRSAKTIFGNQNWSSQLIGSNNQYIDVTKRSIRVGRQFTESEVRNGAAVCIIGETVKQKLFGQQEATGTRIRLHATSTGNNYSSVTGSTATTATTNTSVSSLSCEVVGILETKGQSTMGTDQDDLVLIPLSTYQRRIAGNQDVNMIQVSAEDGVPTDKVQQDLVRLLRARRHLSPSDDDNFNVMDMKEIVQMLTGTTRTMTALLSAVASVSLLVGGIGVMNMMLVSVTERIREIGIRLAIGALEREVLMQFLVEAVVLSSLGGITGIVLALFVSFWLAGVLGVPFVFKGGIMLLSFLFSGAVGIIFGYLPARRAARMDPIEALRHE